jgi:hypothetical protein
VAARISERIAVEAREERGREELGAGDVEAGRGDLIREGRGREEG